MAGRPVFVYRGPVRRLVGWVCNPYRLVIGLFVLRMILEKGL